jgi:hypothetical protein
LPEGKRYRSHRALRRVLQARVRWQWIEDNDALGRGLDAQEEQDAT